MGCNNRTVSELVRVVQHAAQRVDLGHLEVSLWGEGGGRKK